MIRHFILAVLVDSSCGYKADLLRTWASGSQDPLSMAIHDFPLLGVMVRLVAAVLLEYRLTHLAAWCYPLLRVAFPHSHPEQTLETFLHFGQGASCIFLFLVRVED